MSPSKPAQPALGVPTSERVLAMVLALACLAVLITGAWLKPAPSGYGTHTQIGFTTCAWVIAMGYPCPTCGMTTAVSHMAHASPGRSLTSQPAGAMIALALAVGFWGCLHVAAFGSRLGHLALRALQPRPLWIAGGLFAAAWVYKIVTFPQV